MVIRFCRLVASAFGIGYLPYAPGTWASAATALVWYFTCNNFPFISSWLPLITLLLIFTGAYCSGKILGKDEKDPSHVVIDEVAGMTITLLLVPVTYQFYIAGFILFRFFDIVKPLGIRKMEKIKKGWGIMLDDVLAGIYSVFILHLIMLTDIW